MNSRPEYKAKVTDDNGLTRGKVPAPLLRDIGARPGDDMIFRRIGPGKAAITLSKRKATKKHR